MTTLDTLCEKLIKTYNTTIIDQMPPVLQQALYSNAFACSRDSYKQHEKDRTVLAELIHNHFTKKAERQELSPSYIGGPRTLTCHWSETYQKLIYIFGETHKEYTDCSKFPKNQGFGRNEEQSGMPIETYLKNLTEINDIFLDILVEIPAYKPKNLYYSIPLSETTLANSRLFKIGTEFSECMDGYDRNPQKCSRSRIHYIDIRNIERESGSGLDAVSIFLINCFNIIGRDNDLNQQKNDLLNLANSELGKYLMNGFSLPKDNQKYLLFWNSMLSENYYVDKELERTDKEMAEKISIFLKKELEEKLHKMYEDETDTACVQINQKAERIKYYIDNYTTTDPQTIIQTFDELSILLIHTSAHLVDFYTLSRIFKRFNLQTTNPQKRRSTDEPETASNIIIYAGDAHCNTYRRFFKEIGFSLIADIGKAKSTPRNCIDMTERDIYGTWSLQPLFSAWPPPTQPSFSALPHLEQQSFFGSFGAQPSLLASPQQSLFGGFDQLPAPKQLSKQEEEQKKRLLYEKSIIEEDTVDGNVGKMNTRADLNRKARKNKQY